MKSESESHSVVSNSLGPHGLYSPWNSLGQNTEVGSLFLLQEIFPNQGLYPGLSHCRQILYQLNHKGSLRILEWVAYPFSSGSSRPRNWTGVSCIADGFLTNWAIREAQGIRQGISVLQTEIKGTRMWPKVYTLTGYYYCFWEFQSRNEDYNFEQQRLIKTSQFYKGTHFCGKDRQRVDHYVVTPLKAVFMHSAPPALASPTPYSCDWHSYILAPGLS